MAQTEQVSPFAAIQQRNAEIYRQWSEVAGRSYERTLRYSHAVAGDWLELNIAHAKIGGEVQETSEYYARGQELARTFQDLQKQRYQEWEQIVSEAQSSYREVMQSAFANEPPVSGAKPGSKKR